MNPYNKQTNKPDWLNFRTDGFRFPVHAYKFITICCRYECQIYGKHFIDESNGIYYPYQDLTCQANKTWTADILAFRCKCRLKTLYTDMFSSTGCSNRFGFFELQITAQIFSLMCKIFISFSRKVVEILCETWFMEPSYQKSTENWR